MKDSLSRTALLVGLSLFAFGCQTINEPVAAGRETAEPKIEEPSCNETIREYKDGARHEPNDDKVLARAKVRCGQLYKDSPCVRVFTKLGQTTNVRYRVRCGRAK